jgi:hypothetical protein
MPADLPQNITDYIAQVKEQEKVLLDLIAGAPEGVDRRWQAIAKTHIQEGRMAAVRSVTEQ